MNRESVILTLPEFNKFTNTLPVIQQARMLKLYALLFDKSGCIKNLIKKPAYFQTDLDMMVTGLVSFVHFCWFEHGWRRSVDIFMSAAREMHMLYECGSDDPIDTIRIYGIKKIQNMNDSLNEDNFATWDSFKWFASSLFHIEKDYKYLMSAFMDCHEFSYKVSEELYDACKKYILSYEKLLRNSYSPLQEEHTSEDEDDSSSDDTSSSSDEEPPKKKRKT